MVKTVFILLCCCSLWHWRPTLLARDTYSVTEPYKTLGLLYFCIEDTKEFVFVIQLGQKDFIAKPIDTIIKNMYTLHFEATQSWGI